MTGGFQSSVNVQPAVGVEGDFCSANPVFTVDAGPGAFVCGAAGVTVGRFAWAVPPFDPDGGPAICNSFGVSNPTGFVGRSQQGLNTVYLSDASMLIPQGFGLTLYRGGDFWVKNAGTTNAQIGQKAFALYATGQVIFAAAGATPSTASVTGSIAAQTTTFNGSISGGVLTVTTLVTGTIGVGAILTGGTGIVTGTQVLGQVSGATGGVGVYNVSFPEQTVASALLSGTYGLLTVTANLSGTIGVGDVLSGSGGGGVTTGTVITAVGAVVGGNQTYLVSPSQTVTSTTISSVNAYETKWYAASSGLPGELVKMTNQVNG